MMGAITPTIMPSFSKSFVSIFPLEYIMALGGVETGKHIATDALKATAITAKEEVCSPNPVPKATTMGKITLEAAELLIKLDTTTTT